MEVLAHFQILRELGRGGYGVVYKAKKQDGTIVAVKTCNAKNEEECRIFEREIHVHSKMKHPNIVQFYEAGTHENTQYFSMQYVRGRNLKTRIEKRGPLCSEKALSYISQLASALNFIDSQGYVHRDIKPDNIIINRNKARLTDFGLVQAWDFDLNEAENDMFGTPAYMAPEYLKGQSVLDISYDVYSLGITFYFMVTGEYPFPIDSNPHEVFKKHIRAKIPLVEKMPDLVNRLVQGMTEKLPSNRPSPSEIVSEIENA